jgi:hypothetical protein
VTPAEQEEDALRDAIALVDCYRRDDMPGVSAIVMNSSWMHVMVMLGKLAAEFCEEENVTPQYWRRWAAQAANRRLQNIRYVLAWK